MVQLEADQTYECEVLFIKDRIDKGEVRVEHCGAEDMVADYFTKPLQGRLFYKFQKAILNLEDE
eukprot:10547203-Ditylum_brightwellii.AAC.1